jgi:peptide/nickel transport system substrate-binding protein
MTRSNDAPMTMLSRRRALQYLTAGGISSVLAPNLLISGAAQAAPGAAPTGQVVVGFSQEPTVFNPLMPRNEVDDGVQFSIFDPLFRIDPEGVFQPALASEVPSVDNGGISQDGLNWRVRLKDGVKWHDGKPFTAEDVKFTLELLVDPKFRSRSTAGHSVVRDIKVVSPTEITWRMESAYAPYLAILSETFIVPRHILEPEADRNTAPFNRAPIGTGAFKWVNRVAGDHIELVANPDYFGDGPYINRLIYKYIPDLTVLYTQFKSGDIDVVGTQYISPDNYAEASKLPGKVVSVEPEASVEAIALNMAKPQFKDPVVRQAIYAAIDKQTIIDALYYGLVSPTESYVPKQSYYFNPDLPKHEFNLAQAKKLLDDAGWKPGAGGIREKDGVRLSFSNSTTVGNHLREQTQQFLQQSLKEIGIEMTISNRPPAVMWADFWTKSEYDSVIVGVTYLIAADPDVTPRFHSNSIPVKGGRGSNTMQYSNPEVDALLAQGAKTFDRDERRKIYNSVQSHVRKDLPILPLFQYTSVRGYKKELTGLTPNVNTRTNTWYVAGWKRG